VTSGNKEPISGILAGVTAKEHAFSHEIIDYFAVADLNGFGQLSEDNL